VKEYEVNQRRARLLLGWVGSLTASSKPSRYVTSHPGELSLAIPSWVSAMSTSKSREKAGTLRDAPASVVSQCMLVSGLNLRKQKLALGAASVRALVLGNGLTLCGHFYRLHYGFCLSASLSVCLSVYLSVPYGKGSSSSVYNITSFSSTFYH